MKRTVIFGIGLGLVAGVASASMLVTTFSPVQRMGPYYTSTVNYDTATGGSPGGRVRYYKAGVDTLIVGDVVYISAANTVRKSATLGNFKTVAGVVVGGTSTNMRAATTIPAATDTATKAAGATAIVLKCGRTWVRMDSAAGPGVMIAPSIATAGKVRKLPATVIDTFYTGIGRMVDSGLIATNALADICIK